MLIVTVCVVISRLVNLPPTLPTHLVHVLIHSPRGYVLIMAARVCRRRNAMIFFYGVVGNATVGSRLDFRRALCTRRAIGCYPGRGRPHGCLLRSSSRSWECSGEMSALHLVRRLASAEGEMTR